MATIVTQTYIWFVSDGGDVDMVEKGSPPEAVVRVVLPGGDYATGTIYPVDADEMLVELMSEIADVLKSNDRMTTTLKQE